MNEEEKKAIKNLEKYIEEDFAYREPIKNYSDFDKFCYNHCKNIETVLNLIEKLQKENEDITQQRDYYKARYNALSKIVDLMAKHIYSLGYYDCLYEECDDNMDRECEDCIKEYFYKKVKETKDNGSTKKL